VGGACGTHGRGEKSVQSFGGKAGGKKTTRKTEAYTGSNWMLRRLAGGGGGVCGADSRGSG
jgi:hypothetical protein